MQVLRQIRVIPQHNTVVVPQCPGCKSYRADRPFDIVAGPAKLPLQISGTFLLEAAGNPPAQLEHPVDIELTSGVLLITTKLDLEEYVAGVLAGESSTFRSEESLKAMAVAVRTYAFHFVERHKTEGYDFCDTTHCQDLRLTATSERLRKAAEVTASEILWYAGKPAATYYHQNCGGRTEATNEPYLRNQPDAFCVSRGRDEWSSRISLEELNSVLRFDATGISITRRTPSGRVLQLTLSGNGPHSISAEEFRLSVGRKLGWDRIRSDLYDVQYAGRQFTFHGFGAGHGIGLCQAGAARMGEEGRTYHRILDYYYPGTILGITAQGFSWNYAGGERVDLQSTRIDADREAAAISERLMRDIERSTQWRLTIRPQLRIYPTVAAFRDATGEPGWVAASTRGRVIRMQPLQALKAVGALESTLRHELTHLFLESNAAPGLPLWFREGLVLFLADSKGLSDSTTIMPPNDIDRALRRPSNRTEFQQAYRAAEASVARLANAHGKPAVLRWAENGLPPESALGLGVAPQTKSRKPD